MIKESIDIVVSGKSLTMDQAAEVMQEIMDGEATPAQLGSFVTALRKVRADEQRVGPAGIVDQAPRPRRLERGLP